jgi:hypothetical protein
MERELFKSHPLHFAQRLFVFGGRAIEEEHKEIVVLISNTITSMRVS